MAANNREDLFRLHFSKIDVLCRRRGKVYPLKTKIHYELYKQIEEFIQFLLSIQDENFLPPNQEVLEVINNFKGNPIFICGNMKSGTSLLSQLLDGHENLLVLPADSHYVNLFFNKKKNFNELLDYWVKKIINPSQKPPFWFLGKELKTFLEYISNLTFFYEGYENEPFFVGIFALYAVNSKKSLFTKYWVEKTPGNEFHVEKLLKKFPKAKFIHIIRDPLVNSASLKKLSIYRNKGFSSVSTALYIKESYNMALKNTKKYSNNTYFVLTYEDLVSKTKIKMIEICKFLNIVYRDVICIPTENSKLAMANSMYEDSRVVGIVKDRSKNGRWAKELTKREVRNIVSTFYYDIQKVSYKNTEIVHLKQYFNNFYGIIINTIYRRLVFLVNKYDKNHVFLNKVKRRLNLLKKSSY